MADKSYFDSDGEVIVKSLHGTPYGFTIRISEEKGQPITERTFAVTGKVPETNLPKTCQYQLANNEHTSYLDLFSRLAGDFGLRLPQNRRQSGTEPFFKVAYQEVLRENLDKSMLYGYGDPAVLRVNNDSQNDIWYYLLATSNDALDSFPIIRSRNLADWEFVDYVFPQGNKPAWAADGELISDYWAPELHQVGNEFRVYFVAREKHTRELCIGLAKSASPAGPFISEAEPLLKGNVIDPHLFVQDDQTAYLYWKEDNNDVWPGLLIDLLYNHPHFITRLFATPEDRITASFIVTLWPWVQTLSPMERFLMLQILIEAVIAVYSDFYDGLTSLAEGQPTEIRDAIALVQKFMKTPMYAQPLSADGKNLIGDRTKIIENDLAWEAHLVEGMWVTKHKAKYYLFYAGNDFSTDQYGIGVAIADSPLGPFRKMQKPFLQSTAEWWAPGHPSVVTGPDGKPVLFLHAFFPGKAGYKQFRVLLSVPLTFEENQVLPQ